MGSTIIEGLLSKHKLVYKILPSRLLTENKNAYFHALELEKNRKILHIRIFWQDEKYHEKIDFALKLIKKFVSFTMASFRFSM